MVKRSRKKKKKRNPAADLTDDLILEILSRLPVKSVFRFKCVSMLWRDLINNPDHRRKLPQTLAGVFHLSRDSTRFPVEARHFTNVSEITHPPLICPSLSFLPGHERITRVLDACNGLLLCRLRFDSQSSSQDASFRYAVCNPAMQSWVILPDSGCGGESRPSRLGFDPDISLHFYVFEFINDDEEDYVVVGVQIYSSRNRAWSYKEIEWDYETDSLDDYTNSVFLNGFLYLVTSPFRVVAVDVEGEAWRMLTVPDLDDEFDIFDLESGLLVNTRASCVI